MKSQTTKRFAQIEDWANQNGFTIEELGEYEIGANFLVLKNERDQVVSFVLIGTIRGEGNYLCVYSDLD